jgi:urate oxidase
LRLPAADHNAAEARLRKKVAHRSPKVPNEDFRVRRFDPPPREMDKRAFLAKFGAVYEDSPAIAEAVFARGLTPAEDSPEGLAAAMARAAAMLSADEKLALIRRHPELAGRAAVAGTLTAASDAEQGSAGLLRATPEELARFSELNRTYRERFGFPFVLAVAGKARAEILARFAERLGNDRETEFRIALAEIDRLALLRLIALAR